MPYVFKPYVKPYTKLHEMGDFVVITNARELAYFLADCKEKGRRTITYYEEINRFPVCFSTKGHGVAWTDRTDRCLVYITFDQYLSRFTEAA